MSTIWVPLSPLPVEFDTWRTNREWTNTLCLHPKYTTNMETTNLSHLVGEDDLGNHLENGPICGFPTSAEETTNQIQVC